MKLSKSKTTLISVFIILLLVSTSSFGIPKVQSVMIYWEFDNNGTIFSNLMTFSSGSWRTNIFLPSSWNTIYFWIEAIDIYNHTDVTAGDTINSVPAVEEFSSLSFVLFILLFSMFSTISFYWRKRKRNNKLN